MAAASHEMADLLREVQKLQKEMQPVRSAVTALQKREAETPNPAAAGASLLKVATRLESVRQKYGPSLARLEELVAREVPAFLQQTPLLAAEADTAGAGAGAAAAAAATGKAPAASPPGRGARAAAAERSAGALAGAASSAAAPASNEASQVLLQQVCPPSMPHLLQPENVRFTQQQLHLRAEMVEYLVETNRCDIAEHVVQAYGLPLQWFPRLVQRHRERTFGSALDTLEASQNASPTTAVGGALPRSLPTPGASPLVTPATRPRLSGVPPQSPMQLPAAAGKTTASAAVPLPRSPAPQPHSANASPPAPSHLVRHGTSPASGIPSPPTRLGVSQQQQQQRSGGGGAGGGPLTGAAAAANAFPAQAPAPTAAAANASAASTTMPDLVARVVSAAMYLKDEYIDRMVLERTLEQHLGSARPASSSEPAANSRTGSRGASTPPQGSAAPLERYKACVLSRIANIPRHHLHTQSGDDTFDSSMMNIIEELLVYGLQKWAEGDALVATDMDDVAAESRRKAELQRTLTTDTLLTADEMLLADKVWSEDILFLKRPTRFYCVESGLSTDDEAAAGLAMPRARTTGEVVSKCIAVNHDAMDSTVGIFIT